MKKLLYFALLLVLCVAGCSRKTDSRLALADSLIEIRPDNAYAILRSVNPDSLAGEGNRALYGLLMTQAEFKLTRKISNDTLIDLATEYYQSGKDPQKRTRAYFYKASALYSSGDKLGALDWLKRAEATADTADYALMARIVRWMATIYVESYIRNEQSINKYKEALYYYRKAGKTRFEFDCLSQLAAHYRLKNQDSAKKYFKESLNLAIKMNDSVAYYEVLEIIARNYELDSLFEKEKDLSVRIINTGKKYITDNNNYYNASYAYSQLGMTDSAKYYLNLEDKHPLTLEEYFAQQRAIRAIALNEKDYHSAYNALYVMKELNESIMVSSLQRQLYSVEKQFDKKQVELQNLQLKQERTLWTALFFCATTVCIVLIVLFVRHRNRLRDYRLLMEQMQNENLSMKNSLMEKLETPDPMRSDDFEALRAAFQERVDVIRHLVDFSYSRKPEDFIREFNKCVTVNNPGKTFWRDLRCFVDYNYNSLITKIADEYPQLSDTELNFICLMCCNFSNVEIMVCMSYKNERSVCNKRLIITRKMGINMPLERFLRSKIDSENTPKSPM